MEEINVPYEIRPKVRGRNKEMLKLIEQKAGLTKPITECGGDFACTGTKSARQQALQAIDDLVNKGYILFSFNDPCEKYISLQAGKVVSLIGQKGCVINKIRDSFHVELKLPD